MPHTTAVGVKKGEMEDRGEREGPQWKQSPRMARLKGERERLLLSSRPTEGDDAKERGWLGGWGTNEDRNIACFRKEMGGRRRRRKVVSVVVVVVVVGTTTTTSGNICDAGRREKKDVSPSPTLSCWFFYYIVVCSI